MHNLFSNEEEGLDKIHDGRFPAYSVPFTQRQVALSYQITNSQLLAAGPATSTLDVPSAGSDQCKIS
jgi:hypothetical protein